MGCFRKADILIPKDTNMKKWSVIACDQYTSEEKYWNDVERIVGDSPSTLKLIFPEVHIPKKDASQRIFLINKYMNQYLQDGLFNEYSDSLIYVERTLSDGRIRKGIVGCIDLECYDYNKGSASLVRATEGTVLERIPPRVEVRKDAVLELPHVMILIDDSEKKVVEPLKNKKDDFEKIYDFELMMNGGSIKGWRISDSAADEVLEKMNGLENDFADKYGADDMAPLVFAVGDGNHSLASAKACWENTKQTLSEEETENHPARFALCEIVNLHDESLEFEPIHRVVFGVDAKDLISEMEQYYDVSYEKSNDADCQHFEYVFDGERKDVYISNPSGNLAVGTLQNFLDTYIKKHNCEVDYIHGEEATLRLGSENGNIGFILPAMDKNELFPTVIKDGVLPRKTFSMGEADDKRFYLEAKRIK